MPWRGSEHLITQPDSLLTLVLFMYLMWSTAGEGGGLARGGGEGVWIVALLPVCCGRGTGREGGFVRSSVQPGFVWTVCLCVSGIHANKGVGAVLTPPLPLFFRGLSCNFCFVDWSLFGVVN